MSQIVQKWVACDRELLKEVCVVRGMDVIEEEEIICLGMWWK